MTKTAHEFYDTIAEGETKKDKELVQFFVYFLIEYAGNDSVTARMIDDVFAECDLSAPSRTSAYLSEGTKSKPRLYVKVAGGYRLERNAKKQIEDSLSVKREVQIPDSILPAEWFAGTRRYFEEITRQINGSYEFALYDCAAVMMRRLMETLLIEIFISRSRADEIKVGNNFMALEEIMKRAFADNSLHWNRNSKRDAEAIKRLGDVAAHDRTSLTHKNDIDDLSQRYRRLIQELLHLIGIQK